MPDRCSHTAVSQTLKKQFREQNENCQLLGVQSCSFLRRGVSKRHFYVHMTLHRPAKGFLQPHLALFSFSSVEKHCYKQKISLIADTSGRLKGQKKITRNRD